MTDTTTTPDVSSDLLDAEILAGLFQAPLEIRDDPVWVERYDALVRSLRRDSSGLPLDMAQMMLIERIASTYMRLSWFGTMGGISNAQLAQINEQYLKFTTQFQKVLQANDEVLRVDLLKKFSVIMQKGVAMIPDDEAETRQAVRRFYNAETAALGY